VLVSDPLASLFGLPIDDIRAMTPASFVEHTARLVDLPPERLRERRMLPPLGGPGRPGVAERPESHIVCEEFELARPCRSVIRWVARNLDHPSLAQVVVVTDITAEVDLTAAYERLAVSDRLTGLSNRRGAEQVLKREMLRAKRYAHPLSIVMFDVDRFKLINDTYGHGTGDHVLRLVARGIAGQLRESDLAARWGGEEFLTILPNTARGPALACAERIRKHIAKMSGPQGTRITVSGGVAQFSPGENQADVVGRADAVLYMAKDQGRNRIC
jgi:diguanylate cyclase (GGDEF)-like protein